jgi:hypothetical protein
VVRRLLAGTIFAFAAASAFMVSMGVAVPPHQEQPGTPLSHDHVLAAYRFGFLTPSVDRRPVMSPAMAAFHRLLAEAGVPMDATWQMPAMGSVEPPVTLVVIKAAGLGPIQDLAIEFALLVVLAPRLARPTRRAVAEMRFPRIPDELWRLRPALAPPRAIVLP